ncbi:hypothetical protein FK514_29680, partial [Klebsiella pneumoniae]|uniref:thiamine pyrophosphate-dependent enzyme n=1 Tax=Klebsiella pneumoniae TaxID=573 RepID=UPI00210B7DF7
PAQHRHRPTDPRRLAEAYGHVGIRISEPQELETKLAEALEQVRQRRLVFVDVTVDGSEHVYPMQIRGGGMDEMWLSKTEEIPKLRGAEQPANG